MIRALVALAQDLGSIPLTLVSEDQCALLASEGTKHTQYIYVHVDNRPIHKIYKKKYI